MGRPVRDHRNGVRNRSEALSAFNRNSCPPSSESADRHLAHSHLLKLTPRRTSPREGTKKPRLATAGAQAGEQESSLRGGVLFEDTCKICFGISHRYRFADRCGTLLWAVWLVVPREGLAHDILQTVEPSRLDSVRGGSPFGRCVRRTQSIAATVMFGLFASIAASIGLLAAAGILIGGVVTLCSSGGGLLLSLTRAPHCRASSPT
jgi:hypothetical protein